MDEPSADPNKTEISRSMKKHWDHRNSILKVKHLIRFLRELGYKEGELIEYEMIKRNVLMFFGVDRRTVRKYLDLAVELDFLTPKGRPLSYKETVLVRTKSSINPRDYTSRKGFSHYAFGPAAPKLYQETLNPKYIPPVSPFKGLSDGEKDGETGSNTQKNVCATCRGSEAGPVDRELNVLEKRVEKKKEEELCDAHILLDTEKLDIEEVRPKNEPLTESVEKMDGKMISNTISQTVSVSNTEKNQTFSEKKGKLTELLLDTETILTVSNTKKLDTEIRTCPKCGKRGCLTSRYVLNSRKKRYEPYCYFKHYDRGKTSKISWCYLGRPKTEHDVKTQERPN